MIRCKYDDEIDADDLESKVSIIHHATPATVTLDDFKSWLTTSNRMHLSPNPYNLMMLLLLIPASNSTSKRTFSALGHLKSVMRASMGQNSLNSLLILHVNQDFCDKTINIQDPITDIVPCHINRRQDIATAK